MVIRCITPHIFPTMLFKPAYSIASSPIFFASIQTHCVTLLPHILSTSHLILVHDFHRSQAVKKASAKQSSSTFCCLLLSFDVLPLAFSMVLSFSHSHSSAITCFTVFFILPCHLSSLLLVFRCCLPLPAVLENSNLSSFCPSHQLLSLPDLLLWYRKKYQIISQSPFLRRHNITLS